jgi:hypothetical protein
MDIGIYRITFCLQFTHPSFLRKVSRSSSSRRFPHWEYTDLDFVRVWALLYSLVELGMDQQRQQSDFVQTPEPE